MTFQSIKTTAAVAALLMGIAFAPSAAHAQTPVQASITTNSAITVTDGVDMDFGTWFLIHRNADDFELVMDGTGAITAANLAGGAGDSVALELTSVDQAATVLVTTPTGANNVLLNMQRTAITDFTDVGLTLQNVEYGTVTEAYPQVFAEATNEPVTVVLGGTDETVTITAEIAVTATPADAVHTASFDVTFAY